MPTMVWFAYYVCMILNDLAIFYHQVRRTGFSEGFLQGLRPSRCSSQVRKDQRWTVTPMNPKKADDGSHGCMVTGSARWKCPLEVPALCQRSPLVSTGQLCAEKQRQWERKGLNKTWSIMKPTAVATHLISSHIRSWKPLPMLQRNTLV